MSCMQATKQQLVLLADAEAGQCGAKAAACGELARLAAGSDADFATAAAVVVPFGVMDLAIKVRQVMFCQDIDLALIRRIQHMPFRRQPVQATRTSCEPCMWQAAGVDDHFQELLERVESVPLDELAPVCAQLQDLVSALRPADTLLSHAGTRSSRNHACDLAQRSAAYFMRPDTDCVLACCAVEELGSSVRAYVRSSANVEDMQGMSGAGLYESVPNVEVGSAEELGAAIAAVWASLYTTRAVATRRRAGTHPVSPGMREQQLRSPYARLMQDKACCNNGVSRWPCCDAGVKQTDASMAVLIMEMLTPSMSFVLHTASPLDGDASVLHAELAPGLGETLASGTRGSAWRLAVEKASGERCTAHMRPSARTRMAALCQSPFANCRSDKRAVLCQLQQRAFCTSGRQGCSPFHIGAAPPGL